MAWMVKKTCWVMKFGTNLDKLCLEVITSVSYRRFSIEIFSNIVSNGGLDLQLCLQLFLLQYQYAKKKQLKSHMKGMLNSA